MSVEERIAKNLEQMARQIEAESKMLPMLPHTADSYKGFLNDAYNIITLLKQSGYLHPDDVVEGWVVPTLTDIGFHRNPATIRDILDGKAVKG